MQPEVVFDISQQPFYGWDFLWRAMGFATFVLLLALGIGIRFVPSIGKMTRKASILFSCFTSIAIACVAIVLFSLSRDQYQYYHTAINENRAFTVQGCVTAFVPKVILSRGKLESFRVNESVFQYAGAQTGIGFQQTRALDGPIREGLPVRIHYLNNVILRLEIMDGLSC